MAEYLEYGEGWAKQLEADYDDYMDRLWNSVDEEEGMEDESGDIFCGCSVCERRASWTFLFKRVLIAQRDGIIKMEDDQET